MTEQDPKVKAILGASAHVDPDDNLEHMREALERYADETEEQLKADLQTGLLVWERKKPAERLRAFMAVTLAADLPYLLIDDYMDMRQQGLAPKLQCEEMRAQAIELYNQHVQATMMAGMQEPEPPEQEPWWFWAMILECRPVVFETLQRELLKLLKDQQRRAG